MNKSTVNMNYPKLENAKEQFRMLALESSIDFSADIKCHVHNLSRYRKPEFETLSYRWGDPEDNTPVYVRLTAYQGEEESDETPYLPWPVTRNLEQALRALRLPDRDRLLWVDALCINQKDLVEKSQQVRIMALIYRMCTRDLLWIGPEDAQISRAMKLILRTQGHGESGHDRTCTSTVETERTTFSAFSDQDWDDLKSLILHPEVWGRVWIIQELILSPKITLVCGKDTLDWKCIDSVLNDNREISRQIDFPGPETRMIQQVTAKVTTIRTLRMPAEITKINKSLLSTFFVFLDWEATNKRDKVYALLSIATDGKDLDVDYGKTMDELSIDFAKIYLAQDNVRLLSHSTSYCVHRTQYLEQHPGNSTTEELLVPRRKDWPTWIPDLSDDIIRVAKIPGLSFAGMSKYNACGSIDGMEDMRVSKCKITTSLKLLMTTVFIDSIALVNPVTLVSESETPRNRWIRDVLAWAPSEAKQQNAISQLYPWSDSENESFLTAYWRTIVTDRRFDKRLTSEDLRQPNWYMDISEGSDIPEELIFLAGWRFGKTVAGMYCMLPPQSKVGDVLCVPWGGQVPLLLRPQSGDDELYELIGEAYVHGVMDGLAMVRGVENTYKMMQDDPNSVVELMQRKLEGETIGTQFHWKVFTIA
jgi:Heterokaryon incompatibility protein (HET)